MLALFLPNLDYIFGQKAKNIWQFEHIYQESCQAHAKLPGRNVPNIRNMKNGEKIFKSIEIKMLISYIGILRQLCHIKLDNASNISFLG